MTDLITRMAEAAYKRRMDRWRAAGGFDGPHHAWENQSAEFRAEIVGEMTMLRDMVLADAGRAIIATKTTTEVRKRRLSLF